VERRVQLWTSALCLLSVALTQPCVATAEEQRLANQVLNQKVLQSPSDSNVEIHVQAGNRQEQDATGTLAPNARSAVVMDAATGKVLYEKDGHEELPMASITKIMTLLLVMEAVDSGKLKLSDPIKVSEYAASMGGSQIFLQAGETMSAEDMIKGIAIASANDACVALAEHLSGSADAFVEAMNRRAKQLGMDDTHFVNCNGLPAPNHYSSAHDIAIMSRELLKHVQILKYTSVYSDYLRKGTEHPFWLVNTNKLVRFYPGVDGLKTGYTQEAKYCLSATAQRDGFRVVAVVMGEPKPSVRNQEVSALLNWAFANYTSKVLYKAGERVKEVELRRGHPEKLRIVAADTVGIVQSKGVKHQYEVNIVVKDNLPLPIRRGDPVGMLVVSDHGKVVSETPLVAGNNVRKVGFFTGIGRVFRDIITFGS
jgi:D-alanyl-D-alanine carboxypeptidase (penicillin-binding protein 5/6)